MRVLTAHSVPATAWLTGSHLRPSMALGRTELALPIAQRQSAVPACGVVAGTRNELGELKSESRPGVARLASGLPAPCVDLCVEVEDEGSGLESEALERSIT